ncbi:NAD+ synthase [Cyanobacterium sp. HL-69]|uniref:NAD+ synthase n=1 Tax=Cyanobacterium sp. HL-69 TaxID=2054282 RepID=UPI00406BC742
MKIAIAQLNPIIGDIKNNAKQIIEVAHQASQDGVQLLLTPELSLCGYPPKDLLFRHDFITMMAEELEAIALSIPKNITILVGLATENLYAMEKGEKPLHNSVALVQEGEIKQIFHKQLLPNYDVFEEKRYFEIGEKPNYFELNNVKIGVTICEDLWNDEFFWGRKNYKINPLQSIDKHGVELILNLSASPYVLRKQQLRETMLKYLVNKHKIPIIYANQIGGNDELIFDGNSFAVNKESQVMVRGKGYKTDLIYLEYSPETKDILTTDIINSIPSEEEEIYQALTLGVRDYARKCGFSKAVLGLSGGIDSALVAKIAVDALGKENVLGILMPSPYSSEHSIIDALHLAKNLGIQTHKIPIAPMMDDFNTSLETIFDDKTFGITQENLQSRIRGTTLMAIANKFGHLLLSTGNKSEMAVGYCTLYGDMNGGLAVIADIPKTKVFALCRWLNHDQEIIPNNIIIKPPSAELKPGQKDEDSLPPYPILDDILERYLNFHQSEEEIINSGYDLETVKKILRLVVKAEFKRKQAPPVLKITDRAFGTGWKMPIASRW